MYFHKMAGAGVLYCNTCDNKKEELGLLGNLSPDADSCFSGYQCQVCGKFHEKKSSNGFSVNIDLTAKESN